MRPLPRRNHGDLIPKPSYLTLHQGGLSRRPTPAQLLESGARELAASCKRTAVANSTAYPCRAVADMAVGLRYPLRIVARIIVAVLKGGGPVEFGERLGLLIVVFNAQMAAELGRAPATDAQNAQNAQDDEGDLGRAA